MKHLKIFIFLTFATLQLMAQNKPTLLYFGDPMCSWCYGFSPEFSKALDQLDDKVALEMVMGGLRAYGTESMADLDNFLKHHWEDVNARSGQPFKYDILKQKDFIYDTEPSCRAVRVAAKLNPSCELDFFKAVQSAFYFENKNTAKVETYLSIAEKFDISPADFKKEFESDEMKKQTREDFVKSAEAGVQGFPTVVLKIEEKLYLISNGYTTADKVVEKVNSILKN